MDGAQCQRCGKPLERLSRGRPRLYCNAACRKGAQRDRGRPAAGERRRAAQLADAKAQAAWAWRSLTSTTGEAADLSDALGVAAAGQDRAALDIAVAELRAAVADAVRMASAYFDAAAVTRALEDSTPPARSDEHLRKYPFTHLRML
jgi:hypothetical protein